MSQLRDLHQEFRSSGAEVLVILGATLEQAQRYAGRLKAPFPVLADPERKVYETFGLEKVYVFIQRTASVIIDKEGVIRYLKRVTNSREWRQESRELLGFVYSLARPL